MLLSELLGRSVEKYPAHPALIYHDQSVTYAELQTVVDRLAAGFVSLGFRTGDRIALLLPNCASFAFAYYAAAQIGVVVVPANPILKPAELEYIWNDAEIKAVVTVSSLLPSVRAAREHVPSILHVVDAAPCDGDPGLAGYLTLNNVVETGAAALSGGAAAKTDISEDACAVIIYTSGTTGRPKGAMLSHRNLTCNAAQTATVLRCAPDDRIIGVIPFFHSFAGTVCLNTALLAGAAAVILESFTPERTLEAVERHRGSILPAVPALFNALLGHAFERRHDLASLRVLVSGGAPLPAVTLAAVEGRFGVPVIEGDGPTECSPVTSVNPIDGVRKVGSVGLPLPGVEIAIFDDDDRPQPVDAIGEIVVRGENVMLGYLNQPEATAEAMRSGWYHTGDLGKIDSDGYVYIVDRKKDMIIVSGLNVYPREVEEVILMHQAVADVAVIGLPNAIRGEEVTAVIVRKPGAKVTAREIVTLCRHRLANFKVPRRVLFRDALPRGGTGKVVKRLLKKELELEASQARP